MAINRRLWRIIKENKGRYIGIVILMMLGSFYYFAMSGTSGNLYNQVTSFTENHKQEDLSFTLNKSVETPLTAPAASGVLIEAHRQYDVSIPDGELRLFSLPTVVNIPAVLSGQMIENPGDILIDPNFAQTHGLQIGETIELYGRTFTITGTMAKPDYVFIIRGLNDVLQTPGFGIGIISNEDMDLFSMADTVYAAHFKNRENISEQIVKFHSLLISQGYAIRDWTSATSNLRIQMPWGNINSMGAMSIPVAMVLFLIGCLITGVLIQRMVKQDGVVIGTLYAQGYRHRELVWHYMMIPILLAAVGGLFGILFSIPLVILFLETMTAVYILPAHALALSPISIVTATFLPIIINGLASFLVIRRILKEPAVELMKGGAQKAKVNFVERSLRLDRFRFTTKFQIREQVRSIPRLLFLVFGVSIATMILLYGFILNHSMDIAIQKGSVYRYNYAIEYNFRKIQNLQSFELPEGAEAYNAIRAFPEGREGIGVYLLGMPTDSVGLKVEGIDGADLPRNQVNISNSLATRLKLKAGDTLTLVDKLDRQTYSITIDGIFMDYGEQFVFMPFDEFNQLTGQDHGSFGTVLSNHEMDFDEVLLSGVMDARDPEAFEDSTAQTTMIVASVTAVAILFTVVVISLVASLMIDESRSSISMLKIFGYRKKELGKMILNSSTPAVILGFGLGLAAILVVGRWFFLFIASITDSLMPMIVNPLFVITGFILIMAVYLITKWLCGRKVAKISMSEALKAGAE